MFLSSDVLGRGSEAQRKFRASVWLVAAAMGAALLAVPSAAHADTLSLLPTDTGSSGQLLLRDYVFDNSTTTISGSSSGKLTLTPAGGSFNGTIRDSTSTSSSFSGTVSFPHYNGTSSESVSLSVSKDGSVYSMSLFATQIPISSSTAPFDFDIKYNYSLSKGTRLLPSVGYNAAYLDDSGGLTFFAYYGTLVLLDSSGAEIPLVDGMYELERDTTLVTVRVPINPWHSFDSRTLCFTDAHLFVQISDNQTIDAIKGQTEKLMDTSGSSDIGSGAVSGSQSAMQEHMSFMEQVDALGDMFTSITAESDSRVTFPGISFGEIQIPPATVDIWEHMKPLETSCKTICTGVFIFAWFNGMRALYGRIFHDEKDVIVD